MAFGDFLSLLSLLIATAGLALDVTVFIIASKKEKRPSKRSSPKQ
jgi:hypothetical protein